jgi:MFS family permease
LASKVGRKKVLVASVLAFALLTLGASYARDVTELAVMRFLTGIGLGAAMPNTSTLLSEYVPEKRRSLMVTLMFTGFNLGSALVGFVAASLIPAYSAASSARPSAACCWAWAGASKRFCRCWPFPRRWRLPRCC